MSTFELNAAQHVAATTLSGPVLITAGAGSGKTRVLTERAVNAVVDGAAGGWSPVRIEQVLAITYTEKAAGELAERVRGALRVAGLQEQARQVDAAWISTIHGMCSRILRSEALTAGIDPSFEVLSAIETGRLREIALESAVSQLLSEHGVSRLLALYDLSSVASTVFSLAEDLRTHDAGAQDLTVSAPGTARAVAEEAVRFFAEKSAYFDACGVSTQSVCDHGTACAATLQTLQEISTADLADEDLAEAVWHCLKAHQIARTSAGVKDEVAAIRRTRVDLCARLAGLITVPVSQELVFLTGAYAGAFSELKNRAGGLDFSDLQIETRRLLRRPEILERWGSRFALSMVDEFQDTDELQLEVVSALAGPNLCTVGDESQSIYRFRGADVGVYRKHSQSMIEAGATPATLSVNYRSHAGILSFVNRLFGDTSLLGSRLVALEHGRSEDDPPVIPEDEPRVEVVIAPTSGAGGADQARQDLAVRIAERVKSLHEDRSVSLGDVVVLMPTYRYAHVYARALVDAGIETVVVGGSRFFEQPEICALRAALRVVVNPRDETAVAEVLISDLCGLSDDGLLTLRRRSHVLGCGLWGAVESAEVDADDRMRLSVISRAVQRATSALGRVSLAEILLRLVEDCGLDLRLFASGLSGGQAYANVLKLARMCSAFESSEGTGTAGFLAHLDAKEQFGDHETPAALVSQDSQAVRIMSVHASKGLEFPVVIVPELGGRVRSNSSIARWRRGGDWTLTMALPSSWGDARDGVLRRPLEFAEFDAEEGEAEAEERQRLFYVACTRARELLILAGGRSMRQSVSDTMLNWLVQVLDIPLEPGTETILQREDSGGVQVHVLPEPAETGETSAGICSAEPTTRAGSDAWYSIVLADDEPSANNGELPRRLSYSGVSLFERCEMRFHAEKVLGLGVSVESAGPAVRRGSALHVVLQLAGEDGTIDESRLAAVSKHYRLEADDTRRVRQAFDAYRASAVAQEVRSAHVVRREAPFALWIGTPGDGFVLDGTIDVYARTGKHTLIVDYKSGETNRTSEELTDRYALQASCYALAAVRDGADDVEVVLVRPEVLKGGEPQSVRFGFTAVEVEEFSRELSLTHRRMGVSRRAHREQWDERACENCPVLAQMCDIKAGHRRG